jgi:carboxyl-terminal processing protease
MDAWEAMTTKEGARHLVLDLRDNPGGYLREAVNILSQLFEEEGKVLVYTEGKSKDKTEYKSTGKVFFPVENIVVLINENSASASEIIAGCLQDHDRGFIIGSRSYGKGLVQEQYDLSNGGTLRLTVSKYFTPSGRLIQRAYDDGSIVDTSRIFSTAAGRPVHAGGGIIPDITVTDGIDWQHPLMKQWTDIISEYAIRSNLILYGGEMLTVKEVDRVTALLPSDEKIVNELALIVKKRHPLKVAEMMSYFNNNRDGMMRVARSTLVAYRTGEEGWHRSFNASDPVVQKATESIRTNPVSALQAIQ